MLLNLAGKRLLQHPPRFVYGQPVGRGGAAETQGRHHFAMACNTEG